MNIYLYLAGDRHICICTCMYIADSHKMHNSDKFITNVKDTTYRHRAI